MERSVWIGFEPRELDAYVIARHTVKRKPFPVGMEVHGVILQKLRERELYTRPTEVHDGKLWDVISEANMATEFAISRFLVPYLTNYKGWALFTDCDMLFRRGLAQLFLLADPSKAVMVVKHKLPQAEGVKMDGQVQTLYPRKNWSSVMLFNCAHPSNRKLTVELVNSVPGRNLHRFCWLGDDEIGELPPEYNCLVGHSDVTDPTIVHFTDGIPSMKGYESSAYADEWRRALLEAVT